MTDRTTSAPAPEKIALTQVRVFDGRQLGEPGTVVIDGAVIGTDPAGARLIDADGGILLPGLIDAHIHLSGVQTLEQLASYGGDPVADIRATRRIRRIWCAGLELTPV